MTNRALARKEREELVLLFRQLIESGVSEREAADVLGVTVGTAKRYLALTEVTDELRDWHRDGRLPLEVIAMIAEHELSPGAQRELAEAYIREKAQHPKFQPVDFRLFVDEFSRQLLRSKPIREVPRSAAHGENLEMAVNILKGKVSGYREPTQEELEQLELDAIHRAERSLTRQNLIQFEQRVREAIDLLSDPEVAEAVACRMRVHHDESEE